MVAPPVPLWLDCDPGHDDVFAILLAAYHPAIKLLGISTVFGNASLHKTTYNATSVLTAIGKNDEIQVYPGAAKPIARPELHAPTDIHGETGLDGTDLLPRPLTPANASISAVDAMARALKSCAPGTAWLVATGSMTNVAACIAKYPELAEHIAGLSIMGGAVGGGFTDAVAGEVDGVERIGNWTPFAEFNIVIDPEAASSLFANETLARKMTMVPLDVTHLCLATPDVQQMLLYGREGSPSSNSNNEMNGDQKKGSSKARGKSTLRIMLVELLNFFADKYREVFGIVDGPPLHDPLAVAAALTGVVGHEIAFYEHDVRRGAEAPQRERYAVTVITEGTHEEAKTGAQTGRTVVRLLDPGVEGVRIPRGLDTARFWDVLEECCERADEVNAKHGLR